MIFPGGLEDDEDGMSQDQLLVMAQQRGLDLHQNVICQQDVIQSDQKLAQIVARTQERNHFECINDMLVCGVLRIIS